MTTALWLDAPSSVISPGFDYWAILSTGGAVLNGRGGANILDFASLNPAALASRYGWTRTGAGTQQESDGDVVYGAHNLLLQSNSFTAAAWDKTNVTIAEGVADPDGGTAASTLTATAANGNLLQYGGTANNMVSAIWIRRRAGTGIVQFLDSTGSFADRVITSSWVKYQVNVTSGGLVVCGIRLRTSGDAVDLYQAQCNLGPVALDYVPTTTAPVFLMRTPDYTHGVPGLLLEGARTNILRRTDSLVAGLGASNFNPTDGTELAPDSTLTAGRLTETTTTTARFAFHSLSNGESGQTYSFSVFVKPGNGIDFFVLNIQAAANNYASAVFDLTNQAATSASQTSVGSASGTVVGTQSEYLPTGWFRVSITGTATGALSFCFGSAVAASGNSFNSVGLVSKAGSASNYVNIWGYQAELGAYPTSYMPNPGTGTVTRAGDVAEIGPGAEFDALFPAAQGTIVLEWVDLGVAALAQGAQLMGLYAGSSERLVLYTLAGSCWFYSVAGGVQQSDVPLNGTVVSRAVNRVAFSWGPGGLHAVLNGGTVYANASATLPAPTHANFQGTILGAAIAAWKPAKLTTLRTQTTGAALQALTV